jgi:hypothetical protein
MPLYRITLVLGVRVERHSPRSLCPRRRRSPCCRSVRARALQRGSATVVSAATPTMPGLLCSLPPSPNLSGASSCSSPLSVSSRLGSLHLLVRLRPLLCRFLSPRTTANFVSVFKCFAGSCGTVYHAHWYGSVCTFCTVNLNGTSILS